MAWPALFLCLHILPVLPSPQFGADSPCSPSPCGPGALCEVSPMSSPITLGPRTRVWGRCCARAPPGTPGTPCPRAAPRTPGGGQYRVEAASHSPQAPGGRKGSEVHLLGSEAHPLDSAVHLQDLVAPPLGLAAPQGSATGCQIASLTGERVGQWTPAIN